MCCAIMVVIKDSMVMQTHKQHMYGLVRACMRACVKRSNARARAFTCICMYICICARHKRFFVNT